MRPTGGGSLYVAPEASTNSWGCSTEAAQDGAARTRRAAPR